jgi:hypothetical protein
MPGVTELFFVSKSSNRNEVHYGIRLDEQCRPIGEAPVVAWWEMRENGAGETESLLDREQRVYGIARRQEVRRTADGGRVTIRLRALERRTIRIDAWRDGARCRARALTDIGGFWSELRRAHAIVRLLSIARVDIHGLRLEDRSPVVERYRP